MVVRPSVYLSAMVEEAVGHRQQNFFSEMLKSNKTLNYLMLFVDIDGVVVVRFILLYLNILLFT